MMQFNQFIAVLTTLSITASISVFAYGMSAINVQQFLAFDAATLTAKVFLAAAMVSAMFFSRPRRRVHRVILGLIAIGVLIYATFGAVAGTLLIGDAVIFFFGALVAMTESIEARLPRRHDIPVVPARRQIAVRYLSKRHNIRIANGA